MLFTHADVKRLADKEDWVVDNEGITSLVRTGLDFVLIAVRSDPANCQSHVTETRLSIAGHYVIVFHSSP